MGARVLLYSLLAEIPAGAYVDEMQSPHDFSMAHTDDPQLGRPRNYLFSLPIAMYQLVTGGQPLEYRARMWEVSESLVAPFASVEWKF